jgi:putative flippase GtrA
VTCPSLLRRSPAGTEPVDDLAPSRPEPPRGTTARVVTWVRQEDTVAQFARFVLVGGSTTVVYATLFLSLSRLVGLSYLPAHVAATVVSTVLANEMHRRLTFRAEERVSWLAAQWEAGGVSVVGLVATSSALEWLDSVTGTAHPAVQVAVVATVTAVIGALRFVALRWIFRPGEAPDATAHASTRGRFTRPRDAAPEVHS